MAVVGAVPEHGSGRSSPQARQWSEQSPSTAVVWAVPEHGSGLGSPRARQWSGQSSITAVVWSIIEHKTCSEKANAACIIIWCIYLSPYSVKSNMPRLVKKADGYNISLCLLTLSGKQSLGACMEVRQCGPSHIINEEARTLETKGRVCWRRSRGCENNHLRRVRTSPKNLGRMKRRSPWLFII